MASSPLSLGCSHVLSPTRKPLSFHPNPRKNRNLLFRNSSVSASSSAGSGWEREEVRWLREEQRWLREEKRWMRQESLWNAERESLLSEIGALKSQIEDLERRIAVSGSSDGVAKLASLLQVMKDADAKLEVGRIGESGSGPRPMLLEEGEVKEMVVEEVRVTESSGEVAREEIKEAKTVRLRTLRVGSEGEDVQLMQQALQSLGFYSGEDDMEYSSFSSGTQRAVKTWQASLGTSEDGIMTTELLDLLYEMVERGTKVVEAETSESISVQKKDGMNGAAVTSVTKISETKQPVVQRSEAQFDVSQQRVFLLGENRWEDPSRLLGGNNAASKVVSAAKCPSCRGEGRLMCTECDGSGEPNIEEQFMEWVEEGAKCPYCEGLGYTICDGCDGKTVV